MSIGHDGASLPCVGSQSMEFNGCDLMIMRINGHMLLIVVRFSSITLFFLRILLLVYKNRPILGISVQFKNLTSTKLKYWLHIQTLFESMCVYCEILEYGPRLPFQKTAILVSMVITEILESSSKHG